MERQIARSAPDIMRAVGKRWRWKVRAGAVAWVLMALGIAVILAGSYWRARAKQEDIGAQHQAAVTRARTLVSNATLVPLASTGRDFIEAMIDEAVSASGSVLPPRTQRALACSAAEFLTLRYAQSSPDAYATWRHEQGFRERGSDGRAWDRKSIVAELVREAAASVDPMSAEAWGAVWRSTADGQSRIGMPIRAIAADADGIEVVVGRLTRADPTWPQFKGPVGQAFLYAGGTNTSPSWYEHAQSSKRQLADAGEALVASVGMFAQFADSEKRAVSFDFVLDKARGEWLLESISVARGDAPSVGLIY